MLRFRKYNQSFEFQKVGYSKLFNNITLDYIQDMQISFILNADEQSSITYLYARRIDIFEGEITILETTDLTTDYTIDNTDTQYSRNGSDADLNYLDKGLYYFEIMQDNGDKWYSDLFNINQGLAYDLNWILFDGTWNDNKIWDDSAVWKDSV